MVLTLLTSLPLSSLDVTLMGCHVPNKYIVEQATVLFTKYDMAKNKYLFQRSSTSRYCLASNDARGKVNYTAITQHEAWLYRSFKLGSY